VAQRKETDNDRVVRAFHDAFPPATPWNRTIWNRELGILKRALINQGYTHDEVIDAIYYAKLKGKRVYSLAYIPYVIEASKQYWAQLREREAERQAMLEQVQEPVQLDTARKRSAPGWLHVDDIEEVE
jgi:hypothetical protein